MYLKDRQAWIGAGVGAVLYVLLRAVGIDPWRHPLFALGALVFLTLAAASPVVAALFVRAEARLTGADR